MARLDRAIADRSREAVRVLSRIARVRAAYVFGSHAEGTADGWSDIDVAAFVDGAEEWDIRRRAAAMVLVQRQVGSDVEMHFFPSAQSEHAAPGSFAEYVRQHGAMLELDGGRS